jgi:hypothetical protein
MTSKKNFFQILILSNTNFNLRQDTQKLICRVRGAMRVVTANVFSVMTCDEVFWNKDAPQTYQHQSAGARGFESMSPGEAARRETDPAVAMADIWAASSTKAGYSFIL